MVRGNAYGRGHRTGHARRVAAHEPDFDTGVLEQGHGSGRFRLDDVDGGQCAGGAAVDGQVGDRAGAVLG